MQVFFVVDSIDDLDNKIDLIENSFGGNIKFFIKTDLYTSICSNKKIIEKLAGVFDVNPTKKIDEFIKSVTYEADDTVVCYSSAKISEEMVKVVLKKIKYGYDSIYFKKYRNKFLSFFEKVYQKICGFMFGICDSLCYSKFQFLSNKFMAYLKETRFNNHILKPENFAKIELEEKDIIETMQEKVKFKSYNLINIIFLLTVLCCYVLCEVFFDLKFYMYLGFVLLIVMSVVLAIMLAVHNIFEFRYKRK